MTSNNGHGHVSIATFEGEELELDAQSQALLDLFALADDIEAGTLTDDGPPARPGGPGHVTAARS